LRATVFESTRLPKKRARARAPQSIKSVFALFFFFVGGSQQIRVARRISPPSESYGPLNHPFSYVQATFGIVGCLRAERSGAGNSDWAATAGRQISRCELGGRISAGLQIPSLEPFRGARAFFPDFRQGRLRDHDPPRQIQKPISSWPTPDVLKQQPSAIDALRMAHTLIRGKKKPGSPRKTAGRRAPVWRWPGRPAEAVFAGCSRIARGAALYQNSRALANEWAQAGDAVDWNHFNRTGFPHEAYYLKRRPGAHVGRGGVAGGGGAVWLKPWGPARPIEMDPGGSVRACRRKWGARDLLRSRGARSRHSRAFGGTADLSTGVGPSADRRLFPPDRSGGSWATILSNLFSSRIGYAGARLVCCREPGLKTLHTCSPTIEE